MRGEVPDIFSGTQAFGIYVSVIASKHPGRVPQMLAYQTILLRGEALWQRRLAELHLIVRAAGSVQPKS
jgi:hypothetical protein